MITAGQLQAAAGCGSRTQIHPDLAKIFIANKVGAENAGLESDGL